MEAGLPGTQACSRSSEPVLTPHTRCAACHQAVHTALGRLANSGATARAATCARGSRSSPLAMANDAAAIGTLRHHRHVRRDGTQQWCPAASPSTRDLSASIAKSSLKVYSELGGCRQRIVMGNSSPRLHHHHRPRQLAPTRRSPGERDGRFAFALPLAVCGAQGNPPARTPAGSPPPLDITPSKCCTLPSPCPTPFPDHGILAMPSRLRLGAFF